MKRALHAVFATVIVGFVTTANAATVEQALLACKQEDNALKRLVCFDNVASAISNNEAPVAEFKNQPASSTTAPARVVASAPKSQEDTFGLEQKQAREKTEEVERISSSVVSIAKNQRGNMTLTLANGSRWRQVESSQLRVKEGSNVQIKRGLFGAFYLFLEGSNRQMKVKRID